MGRKLALTLVILFLFIFIPRQAAAEVLSVTATVPVSDLWVEAVASNSQVLSSSAPVLGLVGGVVFGNEILGFLTSLIAFIVILIALLWALFRLRFALLSAYIFLLLNIIFAPFWIFAGLIPGSPVSFGLWFRDMLSNLSAFPVTIARFLLGRVVMDSFSGTRGFVPPLVGGFADAKNLAALIGLGFILLTPNVVAMTKAALKAPKFDTTSIKQAIGVGTGAPMGITRGVGSFGLTLASNSQVLSSTVPVSDLWAETLASNSQVLSAWGRQELSYFVRVRGLDYEILNNHKVQLRVFLDNQLVASLTQESKGFTKFSFIPKEEGEYRLIFTDITWDRHIKLKEERLIYPPRIKIFKAFETLFLLSNAYTNTNIPMIATSVFVAGNPIK